MEWEGQATTLRDEILAKGKFCTFNFGGFSFSKFTPNYSKYTPKKLIGSAKVSLNFPSFYLIVWECWWLLSCNLTYERKAKYNVMSWEISMLFSIKILDCCPSTRISPVKFCLGAGASKFCRIHLCRGTDLRKWILQKKVHEKCFFCQGEVSELWHH